MTPTSSTAPAIGGVGIALPPNRLDQAQARAALGGLWEARQADYDAEWLDYFFEHVGVETRHVVLEPAAYAQLDGFGAANDQFISHATALGARAIEEALSDAGLCADRLDAIFFTTVTGVASPSIDARIINRLELSRHIERTPMFGLGCVGGAAGLARMQHYLRGRPERAAVLLSVELCSLTVERDQPSMADYIAGALFADGAAAVVGLGAQLAASHTSARRMAATHSAFFHDTEWVMGWEIDADGFGLVLSGELPQVIEDELAAEVDAFLGREGLGRADIGAWISHPGGPKVLEAIANALDLHDGQLDLSWESMAELGNLSSASVLDVLRRHLEAEPDDDRPAVVMAMGPGFSAEFVLLE
jgi:alkylresorcinol/alkylpyrone synthase